MSKLKVRARVQFSFNSKDDHLTDKASALYNRVAETFHAKKTQGRLNDWLLQLAYEAVEREIAIEAGEALPQIVPAVNHKKAKSPTPVAVQTAPVAQAPAPTFSASAPDAEVKSGEPLAQSGAPLNSSTEAVMQVEDDEAQAGMDESWRPLTLAEPSVAAPARRMMPKGFGSVVLDLDT